MSEFFDLEQWAQWFSGLDREFIFLLALPFVVAIIGLWSAWVDRKQVDREPEGSVLQSAREQRADTERRQRTRRRDDTRPVPHHGFR
jgi:hypothetical protein